MKFEIELNEGEYQLVVEAEVYGDAAIGGADNPDDCYGWMDVEWAAISGTLWRADGRSMNLTKEQLAGVVEVNHDLIKDEVTRLTVEYAKEYAEDAAMDAVDREFCGGSDDRYH